MAQNSDEILLKDLIIKILSWGKYILSKWLIILVFSLIGCTLGYFYSKNLPSTYSGKLTFVLATDSKSGGFASLAGQLGLDMSGAGGDIFNGQNIVGLMGSQKILKKALFKPLPGQPDKILANLIAEETKMDKAWKANDRLKSSIPFPINQSKLSLTQDSLIREIYSMVINGFLKVSKPEKNDFFYSVISTASNEQIAVYLPQYVVDETAALYIETKTGQAKKNLQMLQTEADSLRGILSGSISSTTRSIDKTFNLNLALQSERTSVQEGQVKIGAISTAYAEVLKNLEIAKINLQKETPLYQIIDFPESPLKIFKPSKLRFVLLFGISFAAFSVLLISIKKVLHHLFENDPEIF